MSFQSFDPSIPPAPPPKPSSQELSRQSTALVIQPPHPPQPDISRACSLAQNGPRLPKHEQVQSDRLPDPGDQWLPKVLEDKSKQELADVLNRPDLLFALAHSDCDTCSTTAAFEELVPAALAQNITLASHLNELEARLVHLRISTQSQILSTRAVERQWKQKQSDMDRALSPFSPSSLYQRLSQGVQEQEMVCRALEESFLEGDGGVAAERGILEWHKRYRDAKKLYYSRRERRERWDEGRVGGWR
ncbi:MAG: hypothetical protein M1818_005437 [Claussenomyces sp. TS43310]|nr:MAG: hypothetical protein M1818_005437 [Claussenomyces sp. TS43310]